MAKEKKVNYSSNFANGTYTKIKRAWLLTWERKDNNAKIKEKFVAIISSRYSESALRKILEQYYVSDYLSIREQFAYAKSKENCPYKIQNTAISVSKRLQNKVSSLPSQCHFLESMIIGGNPFLWARIVNDLETWFNENGIEYLKWKERENIIWDGNKIISSKKEGSLKRHYR